MASTGLIKMDNLVLYDNTLYVTDGVVDDDQNCHLELLDLDTQIDRLDETVISWIKNNMKQYVIVQGKKYLINATQTILIEFDPTNKKVCDRLNFIDVQMQALMSYGSKSIDSLIPAELKDHYCLLFGGKVIYSTKDYAEFKKYKDTCYLACTEYIP